MPHERQEAFNRIREWTKKRADAEAIALDAFLYEMPDDPRARAVFDARQELDKAREDLHRLTRRV